MNRHVWQSVGPVDECLRPDCGVVRCLLASSRDYGKYSAPRDPADPELGRGDFEDGDPGCPPVAAMGRTE